MRVLFASNDEKKQNFFKDIFKQNYIFAKTKEEIYPQIQDQELVLMLDERVFEKDIEKIKQLALKYPKIKLILLCVSPNFAEARAMKFLSGYGNLNLSKNELKEAYESVKNGGIWFQSDRMKQKLPAFFIEEQPSKLLPKPEDVRRAIYSGNFNEYSIKPSRTMNGYFVITDLVQNRDRSDLISSEIKQFVFKDCIKTYEELVEAKTEKSKPKQEIKQDKKSNKLYFLAPKLKELTQKEINKITIISKNYNQREDSLSFDIKKIPPETKLRYSIKQNFINIEFNGKIQTKEYIKLLESLAYESLVTSKKREFINFEIDIDKTKMSFKIDLAKQNSNQNLQKEL